MADTKTPSLSPGDLASGSFVLSTAEWLSIKTFVASALVLPTTPALLRASLPADPKGGMDQFKDLTESYQTLHDICSTFDTTTLPDSVKCASDLVAYNIKVPVFYNAIKVLLNKIDADPTDAVSIKNLTDVCNLLSSQAQGYADHAGNVAAAMQKFSTDVASSETGILQKYNKYNEQIAGENGDIQNIQTELLNDKSDLSDAEDEYKHDVIVAATTACYAWVWPCGTIAAGIVAGVYGDKATKAKAKIDALKGLISEMEAELAADTTLILDLTRITTDIKGITDKIDAALPTIQKIQGVWGALKDDVSNIPLIIKNDIENLPSFIAELGIDEAIAAWQTVSNGANNYRVNAYITVSTDMATVIKAGEDLEAIKNKQSNNIPVTA